MRALFALLLVGCGSSSDCRTTGCQSGQVCVQRRADEVMIVPGPFAAPVWVCEYPPPKN